MYLLHSKLLPLAATLALSAASPALAETFTYDALGRLTVASSNGGTTTYQYDRADNWTAVSNNRQASGTTSSSQRLQSSTALAKAGPSPQATRPRPQLARRPAEPSGRRADRGSPAR